MANLIGFDKNRANVEFKGHCKLSINFMSNYLYIEPKNEEFKLISSSFEWSYVMKNNILFVFSEFDFLDFCLAFKDEQICRKIFDYVLSKKKNITKVFENDSVNTSFINPIFQKIADNPPLNTALIEVIAKWYQFLDEEDKEKYSNLMKDYGICDLISTAIQSQITERSATNTVDEKINRKRRFCQIKDIEKPLAKKNKKSNPSPIYSEVIPSTHFQLVYAPKSHQRIMLIFTSDQKDSFYQYRTKRGSRNDEFKCISCKHKAIIDVNENGEICVKMEFKKHSCRPSNNIPESSVNVKLLRKPDYELFENCPGYYAKKILVVFDSVDKQCCYEYSWCNKASKFFCRGCCRKNITYSNIPKANIRYEGTEKEHVEIFVDHTCEKRKYSPENYAPIFDYVLKPDFEIRKFIFNAKEGQKLIILDKNDRSKCYQYLYYANVKKYYCLGCYYLKKCVAATLNQNSEDEEYVILSNSKHVCEPKTYISTEKIILSQPNDFEIMGTSKTQKIFVFANDDRKSSYEFSKNQHHHLHSCLGCHLVNDIKKRKKSNNYEKVVRGKLLKNEETGQYSFEIKPNQIHCCKPRQYQPDKYEDIPKTNDFFYYRLKDRFKTLKLAIYSPNNNANCFTFVYQMGGNFFKCIECKRMEKNFSITLKKDDNGKEYFNHDLKKHICKPVKVSSIPKSDILEESGITIESKPKLKIDESKVIKFPNFEFRPNRYGIPERKLIIFYPNDKTLCYEFYFDVIKELFFCNKCKTMKGNVSAKLHKNADVENGKESFIVLGKNEHVCQPRRYQPL